MVTFGVRAVCTYIISLLLQIIISRRHRTEDRRGMRIIIHRERQVGGRRDRSSEITKRVRDRIFRLRAEPLRARNGGFRQFAGVASDDCVIRSLYLHFLAFLAVGASQTIGRNADSPVASDILRPPITPKT